MLILCNISNDRRAVKAVPQAFQREMRSARISAMDKDALERQHDASAYFRGPHFPLPWQPRCLDEQLPGSATSPSGPMQVCVCMHQKRPSLEG